VRTIRRVASGDLVQQLAAAATAFTAAQASMPLDSLDMMEHVIRHFYFRAKIMRRATLGTIGFEGRFDYAAIGTVSNVASRLCDEAKPGQILISPRVLMAVDRRRHRRAVGEFELKGIRVP
jgi:class 3 adenylate cyclase